MNGNSSYATKLNPRLYPQSTNKNENKENTNSNKKAKGQVSQIFKKTQ